MTSVGRKIKTLVAAVAVIGLIFCVILYFVGNTAYVNDKDYIEYATANGGAHGHATLQQAGDRAYNGLQMRNTALPWALGILLGVLPLYGFGVMVESSEQNTILLTQLLEEQKKTNEKLCNLPTTPSTQSEKTSSPGVEKSISSYLPEL